MIWEFIGLGLRPSDSGLGHTVSTWLCVSRSSELASSEWSATRVL